MGKSFIKDEEKMCDFFSTKRKDFLNSYSYVTTEDYNSTIIDVLNLVDYWNKEHLIEYELENIDGNTLMLNIVFPLMFLKVFDLKK